MTAITTTESVSHKTISREQQDVFAARKNVLCIRDLRKTFGGQVVLDGASADLREGEVVLLRGNNGSGKTTLLNILSGNLEPDAGSIHLQVNGATEHFKFPRQWWENLNPFDHFTPERVAREGVGRTWQDVRLFNTMTLAENIAVASPRQVGENPLNVLLRPGRMRREERCNREATSKRLRGLGLGDRENSSANRISLGQTKRVAIARAVQAGARILFLDEPLAGLDAQGIDYVLELLRELVREHRVTLVIVEHVFNQPHLQELVTTDWLLERGRLICDVPNTENRRTPIAGLQRPPWFSLLASSGADVLDEPLAGGAVLTRIRRPGFFQQEAKSLLQVRNLIVKRGARTVIGSDRCDPPTGFDLNLYEGEIAIIQAPNGWGKSTLFGALCGLLNVVQGEILLNGQPIHHLPTWDRVNQGLRALQSDHHTFPELSVRDNLVLAGATVDSTDFVGLNGQACSSLSGGERQRVAFSGVLQRPEQAQLYLLDEPLGAYDLNASEKSIHAISSLLRGSILILQPSGQI